MCRLFSPKSAQNVKQGNLTKIILACVKLSEKDTARQPSVKPQHWDVLDTDAKVETTLSFFRSLGLRLRKLQGILKDFDVFYHA